MPFNVDKANPADDSIVSQFPANERLSRTNIEGWMDFEHDRDTGRHKIPAGTTTARDAITEWKKGALWLNTSIGPHQLQVQINDTAPFVWNNVGLAPSGTLVAYAGNSEPNGYLFCNGQEVSRSIYADLFAVIGTTYGSGNGSTTFNVPDLRGRAIFGLDNLGGAAASGRLTQAGSGIQSTVLGAAGGSQNLQSHTHTGTTGSENSSHTHGYTLRQSLVGGFSPSGSGGAWLTDQSGNTGTQSTNHQHNFTTNASGSGSSGNIPPAMVLNWLIKT